LELESGQGPGEGTTRQHYDMNFSVDFSISEFIFNKMIRMALKNAVLR
jgi:hypothetical protein